MRELKRERDNSRQIADECAKRKQRVIFFAGEILGDDKAKQVNDRRVNYCLD